MDWLTADLVLKACLMAFGIRGLGYVCGSLAWLISSEEGWSLVRLKWRTWRHRRRSQFSATWTRQQQQQESRVEFHGPKIAWPIRHKEQ